MMLSGSHVGTQQQDTLGVTQNAVRSRPTLLDVTCRIRFIRDHVRDSVGPSRTSNFQILNEALWAPRRPSADFLQDLGDLR